MGEEEDSFSVFAEKLVNTNLLYCDRGSQESRKIAIGFFEQLIAIFIDIMMPNLTGFEVLEELKCDRATCQIPAIVMTSQH
jgi:CheY-like chemotaxis protein